MAYQQFKLMKTIYVYIESQTLLKFLFLTINILVFSSLLACRSFPEQFMLETEIYPSGNYIELSEGKVYYTDSYVLSSEQDEQNLSSNSSTAKETIILIHGFSSSTYTWKHLAPHLEDDYRIVTLDLYGFGLSEKPAIDYNTDLFRDQVIELMDALNIDRAHIGGNSMGGRVSLEITKMFPDRVLSLTLIDSAGYEMNSPNFLLKLAALPGVGRTIMSFRSRIQIRSMLKDVYFDSSKINDQTIEAYYMPLRSPGGVNAHLSLLRSRDILEDVSGWITEIEQPTLILWGRHDNWIPVETANRFHEDLTNSELYIFDDAGHLPQEEIPEKTALQMHGFLKSL